MPTRRIVASVVLTAALAGCDDFPSGDPVERARRKGWNVAVEDYQTPGLEALARPDSFLAARHVEVRLILGFDDIREHGQPPLPREQHDAHAAARAPALARAECSAVEKLFAAKCIVRQAEAKPHHNGAYAIDMVLLFTPKDEFGRVAAQSKLSYVEDSVLLRGLDHEFDPSEQTAARHAMYAQAAAACDHLRAADGNCALLKVETRAGSRPRIRNMAMQGTATLATLRPQTSK